MIIPWTLLATVAAAAAPALWWAGRRARQRGMDHGGPAELDAFVADAGRPVVVNFWASWCPPCHAEAPALARAARALDEEAAFIDVLVDDDLERAQAFVDRYGLPFPTVADGGLRHTLGMVGLRTTVILAPVGSVSRRLIGGLDARSLTAAVRGAQR